jgi:hypothetical protein
VAGLNVRTTRSCLGQYGIVGLSPPAQPARDQKVKDMSQLTLISDAQGMGRAALTFLGGGVALTHRWVR